MRSHNGAKMFFKVLFEFQNLSRVQIDTKMYPLSYPVLMGTSATSSSCIINSQDPSICILSIPQRSFQNSPLGGLLQLPLLALSSHKTRQLIFCPFLRGPQKEINSMDAPPQTSILLLRHSHIKFHSLNSFQGLFSPSLFKSF